MLGNVEIAQEDIDLFASAPEPGTTVHNAPPRTWRIHRAARLERGQINCAPIVDAEIPVTCCLIDPQPTRPAKHDGDRAWHGGQFVHEFSDGLRKISHH